MDKQSILKFFNDNTASNAKQGTATQVVVNNYGDNASTNIGCEVADNTNLTACDRVEVRKLIRLLENKNKFKHHLNALKRFRIFRSFNGNFRGFLQIFRSFNFLPFLTNKTGAD